VIQESSSYSGLDVLLAMEEAHNYNRWIEQWICSSLPTSSNDILDFGAGNGLFAKRLKKPGAQITCIESDSALFQVLKNQNLEVHHHLGSVQKKFDGIYSINVLEHIHDDQTAAKELIHALKPGGRLLIYVPAFMGIYSPLDQKLGHHRRYTKKSLCALFKDIDILECRYVDSVGFLASLYLKHFGRRDGHLSREMVRFYDRWVFPISRVLDTLLHPFVGKNVYLVAQKK
jgi:SAM-dependent methyltransferase